MTKLTQRVQRLSQKASEIRQVVESVPAKIVEIRDAATMVTGHVQKLRADIMSSIATLRVETDTQLVAAMHEIDGGAETIAETGFRLDGVELDLGPARRLKVRLQRVEDVHAADLPPLLRGNKDRPAVQAIIGAVIKAEELANRIELEHLTYNYLTVDVGLIPFVQIGWTAKRVEPAHSESVSAVAAPPALIPPAVPSTLFQPIPQVAPVVAPAHIPVPSLPPTPEGVPVMMAAAATAVTAASNRRPTWGRDALDRFKKMPDLTKRDR